MSERSKRAQRTAETPSQESAAQLQGVPGLPLFFSKPVVVTLDRHVSAGIRIKQDASFARATNSIPLTVAEFVEAAKCYPIVFTGTDPVMPVALVGLEQENYYVEGDGKWREGAYVPAYVRKFPFVFMEVPESDRLVLCVDENAAQYTERAQDGDTKLYENGEPSTFTRNALAFCTAVQEQHALTRQFCSILKELDLLTPQRSDAKLPSGREIRLSGFQLIDQEKLKQLPDAKVAELHKQGWLPLMYYSMLSATNWRQLLDRASLRQAN